MWSVHNEHWGFFALWRGAIWSLNQWLKPKRAAKFAKRASCEMRYPQFFKRMMERRNWGTIERWISGVADYFGTRNDRMLFTHEKKKRLKIWNCNKIGKLFIIDKRIKKKHRHVGVQRIGNHESFELAPLNYCHILTLLALLLFLILFFVTTFKYWLNVNWRIYSWIIFLLWNRVLIIMWDEAGFLFSMWDKYSATLRASVTIKPLAF